MALVNFTKRFNTICPGLFRKVQQMEPFRWKVQMLLQMGLIVA